MAGQGSRDHAVLVKEILLACGARPDCRIWTNNTGVGRALNHDGIIHFGLKGSADIIGILHSGKFLAIEVKTGEAKQSKEQIAFMNMIRRFGGYYFLVRSVEDAVTAINSVAQTP